MASWSWRGRPKARETPAAPAARPRTPDDAPLSPLDVEQQRRAQAAPPSNGAGTADDPASDADVRRTLALVELSRLVSDAD